MQKVAVLYLRGGSPATAVLPVDIFMTAGVFWNLLSGEDVDAAFEVTTASLDGGPVRVNAQTALTPECAYGDLDRPDLVFVPAGGLEYDEIVSQGYDIDRIIARNAETVDWLKRWADQGTKIAAVCSGVALPAAAGLLDGKHGTAHWGLIEQYRERFPQVEWRPEFMVTDAGDVFCGGAINAAADLALYLVEKFRGREIASRCAKSLLIEMPRTWQNAFTHFAARNAHEDKAIFRAQDWLQTHFSDDVRFDRLAADVGMSVRNFARRFKEATGETPINYLHGLRVAMAKQLLESGRMTVQEIAHSVGYNDLIFFRRLFKRHAGLTPVDYRRRFGTNVAAAAA